MFNCQSYVGTIFTEMEAYSASTALYFAVESNLHSVSMALNASTGLNVCDNKLLDAIDKIIADGDTTKLA